MTRESSPDGPRRRRRAPACLAWIAVALIASVGCSDDPNLGLDPICVEFRPDSNPRPGDVVARNGEGSTCDTAEVELVVTGVEDVYGASFTIVYNPGLVVFQPPVSVEGSFLTSNGAVELEVTTGTELGEIVVGVTRLGVPSGATPTEDDNLLATLRFFRVGTSDSDVQFTHASLQSAGDEEPEPIPDVEWFGGTLDVN